MVDPITVSVVQHRLGAIGEEMGGDDTAHIIDPDTPKNDGRFRPLEVAAGGTRIRSLRLAKGL